MIEKSPTIHRPTASETCHGALNPRRMHFGKTLQSLRQARGVTQEELATAAGISVGTVVRNERSERCQLTRSNARRVLEALEAAGHMTEAETKSFVDSAGLALVFKSAGDLAGSGRMKEDLAFGAFLESLADPEERRAYELLDQLITDTNAATAVGAMQGILAGLTTRIQANKPPDRSQEKPEGGSR
jgi:transcriptional regulator with XRE-family HTH domain